jgi:hypothetical protein
MSTTPTQEDLRAAWTVLAAPELLAALQAMVQRYSPPTGTQRSPVDRMARQAIAQATEPIQRRPSF